MFNKKEYMIKYRIKNKQKIEHQQKKYRLINKNKIAQCNKMYYENNIKLLKIYIKKYRKNYYNSNHGKIVILKHINKRNRKLGFNMLYKNIINEQYEWHHINNNDVVAVPSDLHKLYPGRNKEEHKINLNYIIEQIYGE